ncbi:MAG TPA: hypothetical protein VGR84_18725 [Candidatus Acidoferrales bacterium]|nr:hypothetical protein [Candidatus Acidoferrales bacterium]
MTPASRHLLVAALTKLRLLTISRSADTEEMALILAAYADALAEHPGDVVLKAIGDWPKNHKFWPSLAELTDYAKQTDEDRYLLAEALGLR